MEEVVRRSQSMRNLCAANQSSTTDYCYLSDGGLAQNSRSTARQERKKGIPWTELVHRTFLAGLEKLGKGDWRGISRLCDHMNSNINKDLLEALNQLEEGLKDVTPPLRL